MSRCTGVLIKCPVSVFTTLYYIHIIFGSKYSQYFLFLFYLLQFSDSSPACENSGPRQRRRWSRRIGSTDLVVKSMLDLRQLESFTKTPVVNQEPVLHPNLDFGSTISLQTIAGWVIGHVHDTVSGLLRSTSVTFKSSWVQ